MSQEFHGHIEDDGTMKIYRRAELTEWAKKHWGKDFVISIKLKGKKRSDPQNRYYWGVVVPMVRDGINSLGHELTCDDTHEFLKQRFNSTHLVSKEGEVIDIADSTTKLDTAGFMIYLEQIQRFSADFLGVVIPDPNEQTKIFE